MAVPGKERAGGPATPYDVFVGAFKTGAKPEALTEALGERWSVSNGYHKIFACCQFAHTAVEATLELLKKQPNVEELEEITVETGPGGMALTTVEPETVLAAKFSIPHAVAATTRLGTAGARAFSTLPDATRVAMAPSFAVKAGRRFSQSAGRSPRSRRASSAARSG